MTSSYGRPIDSKREEFRKYLEKSGALDVLVQVLVMLYDEPEKPTDPMDYIRKRIGENRPEDAELDIVKADLEAAMVKLRGLEDENMILKERLGTYERGEEAPMEEEDVPPSEPPGPAPAEPATDAPSTSAELVPPAQ